MRIPMVPNKSQPVMKSLVQKLKEMNAIVVDNYRNNPDDHHLSFSSLKAFRKSPITFLLYKMRALESSKAKDFGSMFHTFMGEPHKIQQNYVGIDNYQIELDAKARYKEETGKETTSIRSTKVYKTLVAKVHSQIEATGKKAVDIKEYMDMLDSIKLAMMDEEISSFYKGIQDPANQTKFENEIMTKVRGRNVKMILDIDSKNVIGDYKSTTDISKHKVLKDFYSSRMYTFVQQGLYANHYDFQKRSVIISYESKNTSEMEIYDVPEESLKTGFKVFESWVTQFEKCLESGNFLQGKRYWGGEDKILWAPEWLEEIV